MIQLQEEKDDEMGATELRFASGVGRFHTPNPMARRSRELGTISLREIAAMVFNPETANKGKGRWVIPSRLLSRKFEAQYQHGQFGFLWVDFDENPQPISAVVGYWEDNIGTKFIAYSSSSATANCQKSRLIIPVDRLMTGREWTMAQVCLFDMLGKAGFKADYAAARAAQLCYLPNRGEFYDYYLGDGGNFAPLDFFAEEIAIKVAEQERQDAANKAAAEVAMRRREDFRASGRHSLIQAFNDEHSVEEILVAFGYRRDGSNFRHPNSDSGSFSASVRDGRVVALSPNDPLYTEHKRVAHDAFGAFAVLYFGGNQSAAIAHLRDRNRRAA